MSLISDVVAVVVKTSLSLSGWVKPEIGFGLFMGNDVIEVISPSLYPNCLKAVPRLVGNSSPNWTLESIVR